MPRPRLHNRCADAAPQRLRGAAPPPPAGPAAAASGLQVKGWRPPDVVHAIARGNRMTDRMPAAGVSLALLAGDRDAATHWLESLLESGGSAGLREGPGRAALWTGRATRPGP